MPSSILDYHPACYYLLRSLRHAFSAVFVEECLEIDCPARVAYGEMPELTITCVFRLVSVTLRVIRQTELLLFLIQVELIVDGLVLLEVVVLSQM